MAPVAATKTAEQLDLRALLVRERLVSQRTGIINPIRAFMLEPGIAVRQGIGFLRMELPTILATRTDALSPRMLRVIEELAGDWRWLDQRIDGLSGEIEAPPCLSRIAAETAHRGPLADAEAVPDEEPLPDHPRCASAGCRRARGDLGITESLARARKPVLRP
jgi:hypothetical protein